MKWIQGITVELPIDWINAIFGRVSKKGSVRLRVGERLTIKGEPFRVLLLSKEGLMLQPEKGVTIVEDK
jgi:hypothetical protein